MIQPVKHLAINWVDGMKISQSHFEAQENYFIDCIRDASSISINSFNYGLLPRSNAAERAVFDVFLTATNDVQIEIKNCSAITAAGYRVEIVQYSANVKSLSTSLDTGLSNADGDYYIVVTVNPFEKVPVGDIDPEEIPPRRPNTQPKVFVELVPLSAIGQNAAGSNYIIMGKVSIKHNMVQADEAFIPACASVQSHQKLLAYYNAFAKTMGNIQQYAFRILQKAANANQNSTLAKNVKTLCQTLLDHFANIYFQFRNVIPFQPPVYLVDVFAQQALHLYNTTQSMVAAELEEMMHYTFEWSEIAPHALIGQLSAVAEIKYNHNDANSHFAEIGNMMNSIELIFKRLSELDFIGQRKENIIVNEQSVSNNNRTQRGWSVLD